MNNFVTRTVSLIAVVGLLLTRAPVARGQTAQARIKIDIDRTIGDDKKVRPGTRTVSASIKNKEFVYTFPAHSLTILSLRLK